MHADDLDLIARHLSPRPGVVLDAGCGPGQVTAYLRSLGIEAVGIDMVADFIDYASTNYPEGRYQLGSMSQLPIADNSVAGILAWYSLIHLGPDGIDSVLAELRRVAAPSAKLVVGFFAGEQITPFDHKVTTAYYWPIEELTKRLDRASFAEIERLGRSGVPKPGRRSHGAIAATAV